MPLRPALSTFRLAAAVLGAACAACGIVIGLDDRPARPGVDAGSGPGDGGGDAGGRFCANAAGALLCDDFDQPGQGVSDRWPGVPSFQIKSPGITRDASIAIIPNPTNATSPPNCLEVKLESGSTALLAAEFDGGVAGAGFVLAFDLQLPDFSDQRPADAGGPIDSGPDPALANQTSLSVGGYATVTEQFERYGGFLAVSGANILLTEAVAGKDTANYTRVARVDLPVLGERAWVRVTLATGPRERVVALVAAHQPKAPDCPADAPFVTAAWVSPVDQAGCVSADPTLSPVAQKRRFAILLGGSGADGITARLRFDSVRVDPLP